METRQPSLDRISALPENIIEKILTLMPIQDALRTSVLSKKWRYSWQSMPKLVFTDDIVKVVPPNCGCGHQLKKYKLVSAIFHVLSLHNCPKILEFRCSFARLHMDSEFAQIFSYLKRGNKVKEVVFVNNYFIPNLLASFSSLLFFKLPASFFSLQGLEHIYLENCTFEPPLGLNAFGLLRSLTLRDVEVSAKMLQRFLSRCPCLELICLDGSQDDIDFVAAGKKFTFVDLLQLVPLIQSLEISKYYMKYLSVGGVPHKLPTSPTHLKNLHLKVWITEQNEISSALCMILSSPLLQKITLWMFGDGKYPAQQTSTNFLDPEVHSDMKLDHLETFEIRILDSSPLVTDIVKLIMAKSPVLKKVLIKLDSTVSVDKEVKMLRELVLHSFPRAAASSKLIIKRL